jgi:hypothetical protein
MSFVDRFIVIAPWASQSSRWTACSALVCRAVCAPGVIAAAGGKARDWRLRAVMADDSFFSNASDWSFGGPGALEDYNTRQRLRPASGSSGEVGCQPHLLLVLL